MVFIGTVLEYSAWTYHFGANLQDIITYCNCRNIHHVGFIWLFQSWNHTVFIELFSGIIRLYSPFRKYIQSSGHHRIHANWFHLIISVVKSNCIIWIFVEIFELELVFSSCPGGEGWHWQQIYRKEAYCTGLRLQRRLAQREEGTCSRAYYPKPTRNINQTNLQPPIK